MNTQNGSASSGDERAEILGAIDRLLDGMPQPTTGGEHRIAIAGYGRINNPGIGDSYDAALYPGRLSSSNDSLNTGYYTTSGFHSQSGWTEWNQIDGHTDATLPKLPSGYLTNTDGTDGYDDVFLTVSDAKQVIDADKMVPWYAGAARMDGLRFELFSGAGAVLWAVSIVGAGYLFGNIPFIQQNLSKILLLGILAAISGPIIVGFAWKWFQKFQESKAAKF